MSTVKMQLKNYDKLKSTIEKFKGRAEKAESNAVKDMKSRAPGWIASAVTEQYNIKKSEITPASKSSKKPQRKAGSISIAGETIETLTFTYKGRLLTPTHFGMTPKQRPHASRDESGKVTQKARGYQVSAEVYKGKQKILGPQVFLGKSGASGPDIPFQRKGEARTPVDVVKRTSVPQMVQHERVEEVFLDKINKGLEERLKHHIQRQGL